jgi:hypothetical protein
VRRGRSHAFDGDAASWRLAAEALRIKYAALFYPMLAITTSDLEPLPRSAAARATPAETVAPGGRLRTAVSNTSSSFDHPAFPAGAGSRL